MLVALLLACSTPEVPAGALPEGVADEETGSTEPGALELAFQLDADLVADMAEAPLGPILGAVYAEDDATVAGPVDGAAPLYDYVTEPLDLADGGESEVAATTPPLDPEKVWLLACLDPDGNGCECADPVTVPNANKVQVQGGTTTRIVVTMDLLHPC